MDPVVNFTNILWPHLCQYSSKKSYNLKSKYKKAARKTLVPKSRTKNVGEIDTWLLFLAEFTTYKKRWLILMLFVLYSSSNAFQWTQLVSMLLKKQSQFIYNKRI